MIGPEPSKRDAGAAAGGCPTMNDVTEDRLLRLLGLGVRGRGAVVGVEEVREAAHGGTLVVAVVAPDA